MSIITSSYRWKSSLFPDMRSMAAEHVDENRGLTLYFDGCLHLQVVLSTKTSPSQHVLLLRSSHFDSKPLQPHSSTSKMEFMSFLTKDGRENKSGLQINFTSGDKSSLKTRPVHGTIDEFFTLAFTHELRCFCGPSEGL